MAKQAKRMKAWTGDTLAFWSAKYERPSFPAAE